MKVNRQLQTRTLPDRLHEPVDSVRREWRAALAGEHVAAVRVLLSKRREHSEFVLWGSVMKSSMTICSIALIAVAAVPSAAMCE